MGYWRVYRSVEIHWRKIHYVSRKFCKPFPPTFYFYNIYTAYIFQDIHQNLLKHHVSNRLARISEGDGVDWSTAEALAIGSLLYQG